MPDWILPVVYAIIGILAVICVVGVLTNCHFCCRRRPLRTPFSRMRVGPRVVRLNGGEEVDAVARGDGSSRSDPCGGYYDKQSSDPTMCESGKNPHSHHNNTNNKNNNSKETPGSTPLIVICADSNEEAGDSCCFSDPSKTHHSHDDNDDDNNNNKNYNNDSLYRFQEGVAAECSNGGGSPLTAGLTRDNTELLASSSPLLPEGAGTDKKQQQHK